jgi:thiamine-monophosphate kinase
VGGDTKEAAEVLLTGTAIGWVDDERMLRRSGARPGDLLAVTGELGLPAAGMLSIERGIECPSGRLALMQPVPRVREGMILSSSRGVTSCVDISDGLAHSVHLLAEASGVGFELDWSSIPVSDVTRGIAEVTSTPLEEVAMHFGGDYQLLFTVDPSHMEELKRGLGMISVIGEATGKGEILIRKDGEIMNIENRGWEHFR